jgi:hypothetical protein
MTMFRALGSCPVGRRASGGPTAVSGFLLEVVIDGGAVQADGLGDLGDGVLPFSVRAGGLVHAAHGGGLPGVQLGFAAPGAAAGTGGLEALAGAFDDQLALDYVDMLMQAHAEQFYLAFVTSSDTAREQMRAFWVNWRRRSAANSAPTESHRRPGPPGTTPDRSLREHVRALRRSPALTGAGLMRRAVAAGEGHEHQAGRPWVSVLALLRVEPPGRPPHSHAVIRTRVRLERA